jgi:catechol 2,3-dioxygenase-like lactoylglutathione lyase family enzyme
MLVATSVSPGITANDLQKSIKFYVDGLGFEIGDRNEVEGVLRYVGLKAGPGMGIGIGQDDFAKGKDRTKGVGMRIWVGTKQDVSAIAARAKAAGITLDSEPAKLPWGPMAFAVTDPDGFKLTIAQEE